MRRFGVRIPAGSQQKAVNRKIDCLFCFEEIHQTEGLSEFREAKKQGRVSGLPFGWVSPIYWDATAGQSSNTANCNAISQPAKLITIFAA